ncbi:MAG: phosphatidylglycerophosphatase A [Gammaproteobacteria bacterium]|nr:phosphatidylglycerophosphatase A [Gammaproteobacteria bacterium]
MSIDKTKVVFSREEMYELNKERLESRGVKVEDIAKIAQHQQLKYTKDISFDVCLESTKKILSYADAFHMVQLGIEIDELAEQGKLSSPIQDILKADLGLFGIDELFGLELAGNFGIIGRTNFGDLDVNKPGIIAKLNDEGKLEGHCHTFLDDIVGALAACASTRVAQIYKERDANHEGE